MKHLNWQQNFDIKPLASQKLNIQRVKYLFAI